MAPFTRLVFAKPQAPSVRLCYYIAAMPKETPDLPSQCQHENVHRTLAKTL